MHHHRPGHRLRMPSRWPWCSVQRAGPKATVVRSRPVALMHHVLAVPRDVKGLLGSAVSGPTLARAKCVRGADHCKRPRSLHTSEMGIPSLAAKQGAYVLNRTKQDQVYLLVSFASGGIRFRGQQHRAGGEPQGGGRAARSKGGAGGGALVAAGGDRGAAGGTARAQPAPGGAVCAAAEGG
jgi:hypothetical protein